MGLRSKVVVTVSLIVLGLFQAISGVILYFSPKGRWSGDLLVFGLTKHTWSEYHAYVGFLLIAVAVVHLSLNWRWFMGELKVLFRRR